MSRRTPAIYMPRKSALSRRAFLQTGLAAGAAMTTAMGLASKASAATLVKGGHFRFGFAHGSTTDVLDPGKVLNGMLSSTHYAVTNTLTEVDTDGALIPKLATEWDATPRRKDMDIQAAARRRVS